MLGIVGCAAVAGDAGAHPVGNQGSAGDGAAARVSGHMAQSRGTVADATFTRQVLRGRVEHRALGRYAAGPVGIAEMRHERYFFHLRQGIQTRPRGAVTRRREPEAVHARVHLEENPLGQMGLVRRQHVDLLVAMHRVPQTQARTQLQVARLEHAFEQQDGTAPAQRAHQLGLVQVQQCKTVGRKQAREYPRDAVAIRIGLDHRPDPGVRRGLAYTRKVMAQGFGVDGGLNGTGHGGQYNSLQVRILASSARQRHRRSVI